MARKRRSSRMQDARDAVTHWWHTHDFHEVPAYTQVKDILSGYRPYALGSKRACAKTLFSLNNETLNVWTHLVPSLAFAWMAWDDLAKGVDDPDRLVIGVYSVCATLMHGCSATFHLFCCRSQTAYSTLLQLDFLGILVQILGSFIAALHFVFYCSPTLFHVYCATITALCVTGGVVSFSERFAHPQFKALRSAVFCGIVAFGVLPIGHRAYQVGFDSLEFRTALVGIVVMLATYGAGVVVYLARVPERWKPGTFDVFGHSHQWWHLFVCAAACVHWRTIHSYDLFWEEHSCSTS